MDQLRTIRLAEHILETGDTIRRTAEIFSLSKSTVHKDVSIRLKYINPIMHEQVKKILEINFALRHIRGGESTRLKHLKNKQKHG